MRLSELYGINPLAIRKESASEVFRLVKRLNQYIKNSEREETGGDPNVFITYENGKKVIHKPATDWY